MIATFRPAEPLLPFPDRERIEECLRGVLVHPVAGVDDGRAADPRQQVTRA